jgi:TetR/AcrR family transcriptional regulator
MTDHQRNTEQLILEAAKVVFIKKGLDGARMQEIADEAGINKALLHYYFRSKDKLFNAVFVDAFSTFVPQVAEVFSSEAPFLVKIQLFIDKYMSMLIENPHLPPFIIQEINRNPENIVFENIKKIKIYVPLLEQQVEEEIKQGRLRPIAPKQLLVNIMSMCLFPFVAKPLMKKMLFNDDENAIQLFFLTRKTELTEFIINSIKNR